MKGVTCFIRPHHVCTSRGGQGSWARQSISVNFWPILTSARRTGDHDSLDALEDDTPGNIWLWELRDQKTLPKEARKFAGPRKKEVKQVLHTSCHMRETSVCCVLWCTESWPRCCKHGCSWQGTASAMPARLVHWDQWH